MDCAFIYIKSPPISRLVIQVIFQVVYALLAHEKLDREESSWIALPDAYRPRPHYIISMRSPRTKKKMRLTIAPPMAKMSMLMIVRAHFFGLDHHCP